MVLVQNLLKNPAERKRFFQVFTSIQTSHSFHFLPTGIRKYLIFNILIFDDYTENSAASKPSHNAVNSYMSLSLQEVFPVQYGTKFDTALQALTAGLVCKLEQLLPVPNLSQVCTNTVTGIEHLPCSGHSRVGY